jgi:hypothetical protein
MDFDPWISQASNHKVMSAELLPSVDYLLAPQKWVECPELACFQANMTGNPIFNGKIIRVIYRYIYVVYIHTRNVYYICTYYEFTCIYILCIHMCIYIYTMIIYYVWIDQNWSRCWSSLNPEMADLSQAQALLNDPVLLSSIGQVLLRVPLKCQG